MVFFFESSTAISNGAAELGNYDKNYFVFN